MVAILIKIRRGLIEHFIDALRGYGSCGKHWQIVIALFNLLKTKGSLQSHIAGFLGTKLCLSSSVI